MRTPEQRLWDRARASLRPTLFVERIENVVSFGGFPDLIVLGHNRIVTMTEMKAVEAPPVRATTRVLGRNGLSQEQMNWFLSWRQHGGSCAILIGVGSTQYLMDGRHADAVNEMTMREIIEHSVHGWPEIINQLKKGY